MAVTAATITTFAPELAGMLETQVNAVLADVREELDEGTAFKYPDRAIKLLACHYLTLLRLQKNGAVGHVTSETKSTVDAQGRPVTMSVSYASPRQSKDSDKLSSTVYGQMFERLESASVDVIPVVVV